MTKEQHSKNRVEAFEMGVAHFKVGGRAASATDPKFNRFVKEYSTPDWRHTRKLIQLMTEWQKGWHGANLAAEIE